MKKKNKKNKHELLIVQDFTPYLDAITEGTLTPEEWEQIFATDFRSGKIMNTEDGERYRELFPNWEESLFLGASNAGVVRGHSSFKSRQMLQYELLKMVHQNHLASTKHNFAIGHESEQFNGNMGCRMLRQKGMDVRFEQCVNGMIDTEHPRILIHPDGHVVDRKTGSLVMLAECKTSAEMSPYWLNSFMHDIVPDDYYDQVQVEMEILSRNVPINQCCVFVWNKTGDEEGFKQLIIDRDSEYAKETLDMMEQFIDDTLAGKFYEDILPEEAAIMFHEEDKKLGYVDIPSKYQSIVEGIVSLEKEKIALKEEIAEQEKDIREIEKNLKLNKARLYNVTKKAPGGTMKIGNDVYRLEIKRSCSFDREVMRDFKEKLYDMVGGEMAEKIMDTLFNIKPLISSKLIKVSGDSEEAEVVEM